MEKVMKKRPFIFMIMPITPRSETENHAIEFLNNVREGIEMASMLITKGFAVYCPGADFVYWLQGLGRPSAEDIYEQDISILLKSDAVFTLGDWSASSNCRREFENAWHANIPTFSKFDTILKWKEVVYDLEKDESD